MTRRGRIVLIAIFLGLGAAIAGTSALVTLVPGLWGPGAARKPLRPRLDPRGPYLVLVSRAAEADYAAAVAQARRLHPQAACETFDPADLDAAAQRLRAAKPRYALVLLKPDELDVNFAWRWLQVCCRVDDDPFVDVRTGFVTGETPAAAAALLERTADAVAGRLTMPAAAVDNLGPNTVAPETAFARSGGSFMIPVLSERFALMTISHGTRGFARERLGSMDGAGLLHFGGHGYPDRIVDCLNGPFVRQLQTAPCVVFNGACYTGVTDRWFDLASGKVAERRVPARECFCLGLLAGRAVGYLAALHPDHGVPVYQEMERLATTGDSLGDLLKHTHDGVVLGSGGGLPAFETFADGAPAPAWTPTEFMLKGTAARVLFGDPALIVTDAFTAPPFDVTVAPEGDALRATAVLRNAALKATFTDTYHPDLASDPNGFNDRALVSVPLPEGWSRVTQVEVVGVEAGGQALKHRLVGFGVETDGDARTCHVQVDLPSTGYMQSPFRRAGSTVTLRLRR